MKPPSGDHPVIRHATVIAIGAVTVLMLLAVRVFWWQEAASKEAQGWMVHTYELRRYITLFHGHLRDAVIGERGYLLTGKDEYLEPYEEALRDSPPAIKTPVDTIQPELTPRLTDNNVQHRSLLQELAFIRQLTADNPTQQNNIDEMDQAVRKLLDYLAEMIALRRSSNGRAMDKIDYHRGQALLDHINSLVRIMESEESHLLTLRTNIAQLNAQQNERLTFTSLAVFYGCMVLSVCFYQRNRARAEAQLLRYTHELERREEELKMQQEELKASNEEIEASNEELEEKSRALEEQNVQIQQQSEELTVSKRLIEEKAREVEQTSKYKSEFLANMSHELRTPLNSLLILAKLLAANEEGNLTQEQIEEARVIYNGGLELLGLINDILDLSKVEAGKMTLAFEDISPDTIISRLKQQFTPVAKEKNVAFPIVRDADLPATLYTDTQRVEQILKNLLSNAFKFTEHGSVTLRIGRPDEALKLQQSGLQRAPAIAFCVIDTGIGIELSRFRDIFEAFQQEDGSTDRHYGGTGLGLTIARKFAHMLGGEIHVQSRKGEGSVFTLVLPVRAPQKFAPETQALPAAARDQEEKEPKVIPLPVAEFIADDRKQISERDKVLLIIEDDRNFASTLMMVARRRGYKCLCAGDGKSGLMLAMEQPVTAIILDLKLPDIDGMQVLDQLKHHLRTRPIPVHIISGRDEPSHMPLRKGAIGFLMKPAQIEALDGVFAKIENLLESDIKQVLVVEDDRKTQLAIQALLKKKDMQITIADTGSAALNHICKTPFDCIILDLRLSDMTGLQWLERMENEASKKSTPPVIIYTAQELSEEENRLLSHYTGSIIIKGAKSPERLLDEVTLFLHSVESTLSSDQQEIIRMQHNPDKVLQGRTLLLVDDDLRNTFALSKILRKYGMNIIIADNGQMALKKLQEDASIELVIMDIMMPVMDGYQAMQEIRAQKSLRHLPVIALTARAMPQEQEKCMETGANDYLTKPVDIERLMMLLRVWLFRQEMAA